MPDSRLLQHPISPFIRIAEYAVREPWYFPKRRLLDYLLVYFEQGHCVFEVEGIKYDFYEGDFCLIQPNQLHTLQGITNTITPYVHMDIFYNSRREESFLTRGGQTELSGLQHLIQPRLNDFQGIHIPVKFIPSQPVRFRETLLRMVDLWLSRDTFGNLEAQLLAHKLVLALLKDFKDNETNNLQSTQSLHWVASYISLHLSEPLSLIDLAELAKLSQSHFAVMFRKQFGKSPYQYILHTRIEHAQDLLKTTDLKLHEIAQYCGFADIHHFSKTFKKMTGHSPGIYRAQNTNVL